MAKKQYVWFDGKFVSFDKANVHFLTHSLQYASGIFEGIRAYDTEKGPAVFKLQEHMQRFQNSARLYNMTLHFKAEELGKAIVQLIKKNGLKSCYIRPFGFYNDQRIGLGASGKSTSVAIAALDFGAYFSGKNEGISCMVARWRRAGPETLPEHAKASGNYTNATLSSDEAKASGANEAIMLSSKGYVAEGPGENIFLVKNGKLVTPSVDSDILIGITRNSIIEIANSKGLKVEERHVKPEELYSADEIFFTGTAAEVTPIIKVDGRKIGKGEVGTISQMLMDSYADIVYGRNKKYEKWLTYV